jgi:hypothetical protein
MMTEKNSHMVSWQPLTSNNHQSINVDQDRDKEDDTGDFRGAGMFGKHPQTRNSYEVVDSFDQYEGNEASHSSGFKDGGQNLFKEYL